GRGLSHRANGARDLVGRVAVAVLQDPERAVELLPQRVEVAQHLVLLFEPVEFALAELQLRHRRVLEAQELEPLASFAVALRTGAEPLLQRARPLQRSRELEPQLRRARERIERLALDLGPHQRARIALAVDLEQPGAEFA